MGEVNEGTETKGELKVGLAWKRLREKGGRRESPLSRVPRREPKMLAYGKGQ